MAVLRRVLRCSRHCPAMQRHIPCPAAGALIWMSIRGRCGFLTPLCSSSGHESFFTTSTLIFRFSFFAVSPV